MIDMDRTIKTLTLAMSWKIKIKDKGLKRAKAKCPYCEGYWHGVLAGPRNHLHMSCDGDCGTMLME
jgi:hypothetical protein